MPIYNKLVRDLIPSMISKNGKDFSTRILTDTEYVVELEKKLIEEIVEYREASSVENKIEELADILEIIHAAVKFHGVSFDLLEGVRRAKEEKLGSFEERIFLIEVKED